MKHLFEVDPNAPQQGNNILDMAIGAGAATAAIGVGFGIAKLMQKSEAEVDSEKSEAKEGTAKEGDSEDGEK